MSDQIDMGDGTREVARPVTMKQIAEIAGVSQTTVSRIMNGVEGSVKIAPATRERVMAAARDLGYRPNPFARGLRGASTGMLGLVVREAFDPFFSHLIELLTVASRERGYTVVIGAAQSRAEDAATLTWGLEARQCDGILLLGDFLDQPALLEEISRPGRPIMALCVGGRAGAIPTLNTDNVYGTRLALDHLWELGHRRIGMLHAWVGDHGERQSAFADYIHQRGQELPREYVRSTTHDAAGGYGATRSLLELDDPPTAIFASNDMLAFGALRAAYDVGRRVPDELSVVGFDDMPMSEFTTPGLTTVRQPAQEIATRAVTEILAKVADASFELERMRALRPSLIVRGSTAAPPA